MLFCDVVIMLCYEAMLLCDMVEGMGQPKVSKNVEFTGGTLHYFKWGNYKKLPGHGAIQTTGIKYLKIRIY
jgi:hypothetical protein